MRVDKARLVREIMGVEPGGGKLEKLTIWREPYRREDALKVSFNPAEIALSKAAAWEQQRVWASTHITQAFRSVHAETLTTDLFFDTSEPRPDGIGWRQVGVSVGTSVLTSAVPASLVGVRGATSVRRLTDQIAKLADIDRDLHRPPVCCLFWGHLLLIRGVLTSVDQRFTLFLEDGTPVRATLKCTFTESTSEERATDRELHSADVHKTRQVRRNDSLHSLAAEEYGDPAMWRHIARANGIVNPRALTPGRVLVIPKLRT